MRNLQNKSASAVSSKSALAETEKNRLLQEYSGYPVSSGKTQYLRFLNDEALTYREAVLAKCAECCCGYVDGRYDCGVPTCPLYQLMPYKGKFGYESQSGGVSNE